MRLQSYLFISFSLLLTLVGCTHVTDLSRQEPYIQAIGKQFVLRQDMYIYQFNDPGSSLRIGDIRSTNNPPNIPDVIDERYIGTEGAYITLRGVARKGEIFTVKSVIKKQTFEDVTYKYYISLNNNSTIPPTEQIDTYDISNFNNPPDTKTWSDPPIFQANAALPLSSDVIWWK